MVPSAPVAPAHDRFALADYLSVDDASRACCVGEVDTSYAALRGMVQAVAQRLRELDPPRVVVACKSRRHVAAALLGAWQAEQVVELPPNVQPHTLQRLREQGALVVHDVAGEPGLHLPSVAPADSHEPLRVLPSAQPLVRLHTSGSTATPRTVEKTAGQLLGEVEALAARFADLRSTCFLATVPAYHLYGLLFGVLLPLRLGARCSEAGAFFASDVGEVASSQGALTLISTPAHLRSFARAALPRELFVVSSAGRLDAELHAELVARFAWTVHDVYGSTETGGIAVCSAPGAALWPLPGVQVGCDEQGRLLVRSAWTSTAQADDLVELAGDGSFQLRGRLGRVAKIAGKRVDLAALEAALLRAPEVLDAAVWAYDDPARGQRLGVVVAPENVDTAQIRRALLAEFDPAVLPRTIRRLPSLPREPTGKLRRDALTAIPLGAGLLAWRGDVDSWRVQVTAASPFFEGHFPDRPVFPGAALLTALILPLARRQFPDLGAAVALTRLRFLQPVVPGDELQLQLVRKDLRIDFVLARHDDEGPHRVTTGAIDFSPFRSS